MRRNLVLRYAASAALLLVLGTLASSSSAAEPIPVDSVLLKLVERAEVPARQAGVLVNIAVEEGQSVKPGDLLAQIDDEETELKRKRSQFELAIAERRAKDDIAVRLAMEDRDVAERDYQRAKMAREQLAQSVSISEFEHLQLKAAQTRLAVEKAQEELEVARLARQLRSTELALADYESTRRRIVAPFAGIVAEIYPNRGEWVEPGDRVLRLVRLDRLRAEGFVNLQSVERDLVGKKVQLTIDLPGRTGAKFVGKLLFVSPEIDPINRQTRVVAEVDNKDLALQPGLRPAMVILPE